MKKKTTLSFCTTILTCVFSLLLVAKGFSQEVKIYELFENGATSNVAKVGKTVLKTQTATDATYTGDLKSFYELDYNLKPTIYIQNNTIVNAPDGEVPVKVKMEDTNSFNVLMSNNSIFNKVELITIYVDSPSQLMSSLNVSTLQGFNNLKYIYVQCNQFNSSVSQMQNFVTNVESNITVYFMTINPS